MIPLNRKPCGIAALFGALLPAALGAGGCARVSTVSEVRPDGSMTRTVTYKGTAPAAPRETAAGGETPVSESSEMSISPRLEELIALPSGAAGSGWTVTRTRDDRSSVVVTATRTVAAGQALHNDLGIRMPKPKPAGPPGKNTIAAPAPMPGKVRPLPALLLENTATVRTITPGKLEYRETLHWRGPRPTEIDTPDPGMLAALRRS
ncbi:MAG: hypothetical protein H7Z41_08995, partial [Cytophagales bacterium]|nr:hypothetical protein [Armatimonadota bacterium]